MKKYLFFSLLIIISLLALSGWSVAQALSQTGEAEIYISPSTDVPSTLKLETRSFALPLEKCGVNTFTVLNECGIGAFKNVYFQCYDGYEEKQGGKSSCKSSEVWQKYAESVCTSHCGIIKESVPVAVPLPKVIEIVSEPIAISVCYIGDRLMKDYNVLMLELKETETAGDKVEAERITGKIIDLKRQIEKSKEECNISAQQPQLVQLPTEEAPRPVVIDRCGDVTQIEKKIAYYENLRNLSDADVTKETGSPREELGIEDVIAELLREMEKVKEQCSMQMGTFIVAAEQIRIAEPVNPVVAESGQEIDIYYKAKIERITTLVDIDKQIESLKILRGEVDQLIERLLKSRKEIEVGEFGNLITEIKLSQGEIKADNIVVKTTEKKILMEVGDKSISVEPTENDVLIRDSGLEVKATELSIKENVLRVGTAEVKVAASDVVKKLKVLPISVELKEEDKIAVYKMKVEEPRKLFGFIPLTIQKTITTDADEGNLLKEDQPWYTFLTTK